MKEAFGIRSLAVKDTQDWVCFFREGPPEWPSEPLSAMPPRRRSPYAPTPSVTLCPHAVGHPMPPRRRSPYAPTPSVTLCPHAVGHPMPPRRRSPYAPTPSVTLCPHAVGHPMPPRRRSPYAPTPSVTLCPHAVGHPMPPRRRSPYAYAVPPTAVVYPPTVELVWTDAGSFLFWRLAPGRTLRAFSVFFVNFIKDRP